MDQEYRTLEQSTEADDSLPLPESKAVLANELSEDNHPFRVIDRAIDTHPTRGYQRIILKVRPLDTTLAPSKLMQVIFSYNFKADTDFGRFLNNQNVEIEYLENGRVNLKGLVGSCFNADVTHKANNNVIYANIDRDTIKPAKCGKQED